MVLADTSIWVAYLRSGAEDTTRRLDELLDRGETLVCGPVVAELLAGAGPHDRSRLWPALRGLPWAELDHEGWHDAGVAAADLRAAGARVPLTDIEIAVAAARSEAAVWSEDSDFQRVATVLPALRLLSTA